MSPLSRRAFLGSVAAIPAAGFMSSQSAPMIIGGEIGGARITPVIMGIVPRDWLKLPYYRVLDADAVDWAAANPNLILVTSHDQDPEFHTSEVIPSRCRDGAGTSDRSRST